MFVRSVAVLLAALSASGATIQLKEKASVTGKILAEKRDQIIVDIGYTVLTVPRNQIVKIFDKNLPETDPVPATKPVTDQPVAVTQGGIFTANLSPPPERSVRDLSQELGSAVVQVRTPSGLGSGFIISEDGFLITNFHVIEGESQVSVEVYFQKNGQLDRQVFKQVRIAAMNKFADLALLQIQDKEAPKFNKVSLGDSELLAVGDRVFAIGSPLGLERTVTEGIVSTKTRQLMGELYLQTSAQINPGNSGGPLFNLRGEVIGVINMKLSIGEGLGFAIPIDTVKFFLKHRDAFAYDNDNPSNPYRYLEPPNRTKLATQKDS